MKSKKIKNYNRICLKIVNRQSKNSKFKMAIKIGNKRINQKYTKTILKIYYMNLRKVRLKQISN